MAPYIETMPQQPSVNGTRLFYELSRSGDPLVLVHGSWVDHKDWQLVVPGLTKSFRVHTYDRRATPSARGHSGQGLGEKTKRTLPRSLKL